MSQPDLSVVIVNTNSLEKLKCCLQSVFGSKLPPVTEVIVVDNCSVDGSPEFVAETYPQVRLVRKDSRRGPAHNYNAGYSVARGRYLVGVNEDAEIRNDALLKLFEFLEENPQVGMAAPRLSYPDGSHQSCCYRFPTWFSAFQRLVLQKFFRGTWIDNTYPEERAQKLFYPDWIMATCLMYRRGVMEQLGQYDERFEIFYEETEMAARLKKAGWRIAWVPQAEVMHHHGVSRSGIANDRDIHFRVMLYQSRYRYFRKVNGLLYSIGLRALESVLLAGLLGFNLVASALRGQTSSPKVKLYRKLLAYAILLGPELSIPPAPRPA